MNFANKQVLIIEDQRPFLLLLRGLLNAMGCQNVVTKSSAEQGISESRKTKFDIIVSDLHLGANKKNGFELVEELRERRLITPSCIFILISADSARPVVLGSLERSPDDYVVKPFSLMQLRTRINRAWQKRQFFLSVFRPIAEGEYERAKNNCEQLLLSPSPYKGSCEKILVEICWHLNDTKRALEILTPYAEKHHILWSQIALAKTYLLMNSPERAITAAENTIIKHRFSADAHDILAQAHDLQENGELAVAAIKQAIKLSPYSLHRHYIACEIAKNNDNFLLVSESSKAIWELSKRTMHNTSLHWCGYIRSLLDVAEYTDEKRTKNRYQQEAMLEVQRGKFDECLIRLSDSFDIGIYTHIVNARINTIDGKMVDAKQSISQSQYELEQKFGETPATFLPDTLKVMYDIGEFEDASELVSNAGDIREILDPNSVDLIERERQRVQDNISNYQQFNREGIELYQQGQYEKARDAFVQAQCFAPVNMGVTLNLLQCVLKILDKNKKPEPTLVKECRRIHKFIEDMPLKKQHQEKYDALHQELMTYIGK